MFDAMTSIKKCRKKYYDNSKDIVNEDGQVSVCIVVASFVIFFFNGSQTIRTRVSFNRLTHGVSGFK